MNSIDNDNNVNVNNIVDIDEIVNMDVDNDNYDDDELKIVSEYIDSPRPNQYKILDYYLRDVANNDNLTSSAISKSSSTYLVCMQYSSIVENSCGEVKMVQFPPLTSHLHQHLSQYLPKILINLVHEYCDEVDLRLYLLKREPEIKPTMVHFPFYQYQFIVIHYSSVYPFEEIKRYYYYFEGHLFTSMLDYDEYLKLYGQDI